MNKPARAKAVVKTMWILECLSHERSVGITELARRVSAKADGLQMNKSTVYWFLASLKELGFVDKFRIADVFPLGGRESVIDACQKDQIDGGNPRIYLIDGDLGLILGSKVPSLKRLFVLPIYCIENLLIDETAVVEVLFEENHTAERDELANELDFDAWLASIQEPLKELFVDYAICWEVVPAVQTVAHKINQLVSNDDGTVDLKKVNSRSQSIQTQILSVLSSDSYRERRKLLVDSLRARSLFDARLMVSGKDYLLPLLRMRMRKITKIRSDNEIINIRLAKYCDTSLLESICIACSGLFEAPA